MNIYKIKIRPISSQITPWHSDTVFGSLCWIMLQTKGEEELKKFLAEYEKGNYPLTISCGFPGDYLPKPLTANCFDDNGMLTKDQALEQARKNKQSKKTNWLSLNEFNTVINNGRVDVKPKEKLNIVVGVMHNQISRITDTTIDAGLYETLETFWYDTHISIYLGIEPGWEQLVLDMFEQLSLRGFGKRANVGKGHFAIEDFSQFNGFAVPDNANSFVVLSNYVPCKNDPIIGQYQIFVKYGKLGQEYAHSGYPFKKPVLMLKPGSVFWTDQPKLSYGRLVRNVSGHFPGIVQCGCTLAVPACIDKPNVEWRCEIAYGNKC